MIALSSSTVSVIPISNHFMFIVEYSQIECLYFNKIYKEMVSLLLEAVELRLREKRARQSQNFVGLAQFLHLAFQRLDPFPFG